MRGLAYTCLKDSPPAGPCGWTEQSNRTVWALASCQSQRLAWEPRYWPLLLGLGPGIPGL